ncbi:hypothetical protein GE061_007372 [Apolygus lucorum]|uniref:Sulfatase N-terminal domain-containing protein n=1 Tax=Apolygus lucorum TaxID=248454 RepID=A0A8S9WU43_APOLU|nr:hypothetical protein GE061_007372 [Apolygus lucorum]
MPLNAFWWSLFVVFFRGSSSTRRPHIIFILADDLGWSDVGFHGSNDVRTPNIDALAYSGLILNSHYSENLCSPSRAALLTGKYPIRNGMQHNVIVDSAPWGLPLDEKLLPEHLNKLGYVSHAVGKWHLGFFKKAYTPIYRGFASHYGFWNSHQDYFSHQVQASFLPFEGLDMRDNMTVDRSTKGRYTTRILTERAEKLIAAHNASSPMFLYFAHLATHAGNFDDPLQAPQEAIDMFSSVRPLKKRIYTAMVWELDQSIGRLVAALKRQNMLQDSIIAFVSDNGAPTTGLYRNGGNNWPFKGEKNTPWEGALRTVAILWSSSLAFPRRVVNHLMHLTDWMPTLYTAAGGNVRDLGRIDGVNHWDFFTRIGRKQPRHEILHNIDDIYQYSAMRIGPYKYVNGTTFLGCLDGWYGTEDSNTRKYNITDVLQSSVLASLARLSESEVLRIRETSKVRCPSLIKDNAQLCQPTKQPCLFNIHKDPCETNNIYGKSKKLIEVFEKRLAEFRADQVPPGNKKTEKAADPKYFNGTWTYWRDLEDSV